MSRSDRIEIDPDIMRGKPVIRGTRVTVELLLRKLSQGGTEESILASYPHLTREDIRAAIAYAADTIAERDPAKDGVAPRRLRKPQTSLFKGPGGKTAQLIGESDEQPVGHSSWRSS